MTDSSSFRHVIVTSEQADDVSHIRPPLTADEATIVRIPSAGDCELRLRHSQANGGQFLVAGQGKVWPAALALVDVALDTHMAEFCNGARVIELGCGLAVPGMVCAALGAHTVLTDVPEVKHLLDERIADNMGKQDPTIKGTAIAASLRWSAEDALALSAKEGPFDFVLCSDCVYEPLYGRSWRPLAEVTTALCDAGATALISLQRRPGNPYGDYSDDGVDKFLDVLETELVVEQIFKKELGEGTLEVFEAKKFGSQPRPLQKKPRRI